MGRIRILIADDHPVVRAGLQSMLASHAEFEVVGAATSGDDAVRLTAKLTPDVVLMDLRLTGIDGATATAQIKKRHPETAVLVLTTYAGNADILRAIEAGATGYLLKDTPQDELIAAIHMVVQGNAVLAPVATRFLQERRLPTQEALSAREIEILTLVARGASNKEAAQQLHISEATVKTHLIHIFGKLGVADRTAAVTSALERGLLSLD
jgi:DNA-binding NarL/FixJ family response regulator